MPEDRGFPQFKSAFSDKSWGIKAHKAGYLPFRSLWFRRSGRQLKAHSCSRRLPALLWVLWLRQVQRCRSIERRNLLFLTKENREASWRRWHISWTLVDANDFKSWEGRREKRQLITWAKEEEQGIFVCWEQRVMERGWDWLWGCGTMFRAVSTGF